MRSSDAGLPYAGTHPNTRTTQEDLMAANPVSITTKPEPVMTETSGCGCGGCGCGAAEAEPQA